MSEGIFGFPVDENGDVKFMTLTLETPVRSYDDYQAVLSV